MCGQTVKRKMMKTLRVKTAAARAEAPALAQTVKRKMMKTLRVKTAAARAEAPALAKTVERKKTMMKNRSPPPLQLQAAAEPRFPAPRANLGDGCALSSDKH
jgi:hypothetical protein